MNFKNIHPWIYYCILCIAGFTSDAQCQDSKINHKAYESLEINPLNWINTPFLEFSPAYYKEGLIYIASGEKRKEFDKELNESFFEIRFEGVENMDDSLAYYITKLNELNVHKGPGSFSLNDSIFYFTIEHRSEEPGIKSTLKIHSISNEDGHWLLKEVPFLQQKYFSYCHPSVDQGNNLIIFASDMPGGYGGMDLYMCAKTDSVWKDAINLGPFINTEKNELFPFMYDENTLFFASERENGFGGMDIYVCDLLTKNTQILRTPFNSAQDDFGFLLSEDSYTGFFSSSRLGESTKDDIFQFELQSPLFTGKEKKMAGQIDFRLWVRDNSTGFPIKDVKAYVHDINTACDFIKIDGYDIQMMDEEKNEDGFLLKLTPKQQYFENWHYQTDSLGILKIPVGVGSQYIFSLRKEGYESQKLILNPSSENFPTDIFMAPIKTDVTSILLVKPELESLQVDPILTEIINSYDFPAILITKEKGEVVVLNRIYYDYNRKDIKKGAARELDGLALQMKQNPAIIIELSAHTDSRGDSDYNLALSEARAQAAKKYLIDQGIASNRIKAIGLGEQMLMNHCAEGVICSESEHQMNRRTEVKVLEN